MERINVIESEKKNKNLSYKLLKVELPKKINLRSQKVIEI